MQTQQQNQYRQGDVFIFAATIPDDVVTAAHDPRGLVLAAGTATGHHHRIGPAFKNAILFRTKDGSRTFLRVTPLKSDAVVNPQIVAAAAKARDLAAPLLAKVRDLDSTNVNHDADEPSVSEAEIDALEAQIYAILEPERMYLAAKREVDLAHGAVALTHEEHDAIVIPPDDYEVYIQREYQPDGVQMVED